MSKTVPQSAETKAMHALWEKLKLPQRRAVVRYVSSMLKEAKEEKKPRPHKEAGVQGKRKEFFYQGWEARAEGYGKVQCPYRMSDYYKRDAWMRGWESADKHAEEAHK